MAQNRNYLQAGRSGRGAQRGGASRQGPRGGGNRQQQRRRQQRQQRGQRQGPRGGRGQGQRKGQNRGQNRRRRQRQRNRPNPVTRPITPERLGKEVRAAANQKFRPLEREIGGEIRASKKRVGEQGNWWQDYKDTVAQAQAGTAAAYAQAGESAEDFMEQAGDRDQSFTDSLQREAAKSAALRGATPNTNLAEREAAGSSQRQMMSAAEAASLAGQAADQYAYLADKMRIGAGQSIAGRKQEQSRTRSLERDRRDTRRERGDFAQTYRGDLRDREREYLIQRGVAKLDQRKQGADEREGARDAREGRQERREDRRQKAIENRQRQEGIDIDRAESRDGGGKDGPTRSERRQAREGRQNAMKATQRLIKANGRPKSEREWAGLEILVSKEEEISPREAAWAVDRIKARMQRRRRKQRSEPSRNAVLGRRR